MLNRVEHEKSFITSGPGIILHRHVQQWIRAPDKVGVLRIISRYFSNFSIQTYTVTPHGRIHMRSHKVCFNILFQKYPQNPFFSGPLADVRNFRRIS